MRRPSFRHRTSGPPDFVGVGTVGAGSGWWFKLLLRHPQVDRRLGRPRSVHFFDEFCARAMTDADVARYHAQFRRRPGMVAGEWTPRYVYDPWTPPLLRRAAPDAKLLVLLSDPIERYRARMPLQGVDPGASDLRLLLGDTVARGRYATQLADLTSLFPPEQVLVLQYERCQLDVLGEYARTLRFLGLDDGFDPLQPMLIGRTLQRVGISAETRTAIREKLRRTPPPPEPLWAAIEEDLHSELDAEVAALPGLVPDLDLGLWPNFAHLAHPG